jgi:hypothetical protein
VVLIAVGSVGVVAQLKNVALRALLLIALALQPMAWSTIVQSVPADVPALDDLSASLTETPPPRALVVVETDFVAASWMMAREVSGARPDIALLTTGLSTSSWPWRSRAPHPSYDGRPIAGQGRTAHERYTNGAIGQALGSVAIAAEPSAPLRRQGSLAGPYLVTGIRALSSTPIWQRSMGERWAAEIARQAAHGPAGDHDSAGAVLRAYEVERAWRQAVRGQPQAAAQSLSRALSFLERTERALLTSSAGGATIPPRSIPVVHAHDAFLMGREDAVREAAAFLATYGNPEAALSLLEAQQARGDARAMLQRGWLALALGDREAAQAALQAFIGAAPEWAAEAAPLSRALARPTGAAP